MTESKIELTERLRREGRWAEASKFKDTALKEFRGKGMKKAPAAEEAWEAMAKAYPPMPPTAPAPSTPREIAAASDAGDIENLAEWVRENITDWCRDHNFNATPDAVCKITSSVTDAAIVLFALDVPFSDE